MLRTSFMPTSSIMPFISKNKIIFSVGLVALAIISVGIAGFCRSGRLANCSTTAASVTLSIGIVLVSIIIFLKRKKDLQNNRATSDQLLPFLKSSSGVAKVAEPQEKKKCHNFFEYLLLPYLDFQDVRRLRSVSKGYQTFLPEAYLLFDPVGEIFNDLNPFELKRYRMSDAHFDSITAMRTAIEELVFSDSSAEYPPIFRLQYYAFNTIHEVVLLKYTLFLPKEASINPLKEDDRVWHDYCVIENHPDGPSVYDMRVQLQVSSSSACTVREQGDREFPQSFYCRAFVTTCFAQSHMAGGSLLTRDKRNVNVKLQSSVADLVTKGRIGFFSKDRTSPFFGPDTKNLPYLVGGAYKGWGRVFDDVPVVLGHHPINYFNENFFIRKPNPHFVQDQSASQVYQQQSGQATEILTF